MLKAVQAQAPTRDGPNPCRPLLLCGPRALLPSDMPVEAAISEPPAVSVALCAEARRDDRAAGLVSLAAFRHALALAVDGAVAAVCFTPFTKHAMRLADQNYVDEASFIVGALGLTAEPTEINVLPGLWNVRVTSHIPLAQVSAALTTERILARVRRTHALLRQSGHVDPVVAVAGLNPHAGDQGLFGAEEEALIAPAVRSASASGLRCIGPVSPDTVFVRARRGEFQAVVTMYHDQGQIAMKLIGFDEGVVAFDGAGFPVTTPAHGSARDIAGRGIAQIGATLRAIEVAGALAGRVAA